MYRTRKKVPFRCWCCYVLVAVIVVVVVVWCDEFLLRCRALRKQTLQVDETIRSGYSDCSFASVATTIEEEFCTAKDKDGDSGGG